MRRLVVVLIIACAVLAIVALILWSRRESTITVRHLGDPLRELKWAKGEGTRSYMLMYSPLECEGYCALVRAWIFRPYGACPSRGVIEVSAGSATAKLEAPYVRHGAYCDLRAFIVVASSPLRLSWRDTGITDVDVKGRAVGKAAISGSLVAVATETDPRNIKGWTSAVAPCVDVQRMMVKEVSKSPHTILVYVEAKKEVKLVIESGSDRIEIKPLYSRRGGSLVSGVVVISAPEKVSIRC